MALTRQLMLGEARVMREKYWVREKWGKRSGERGSEHVQQVLDFRTATV